MNYLNSSSLKSEIRIDIRSGPRVTKLGVVKPDIVECSIAKSDSLGIVTHIMSL